MKTIAYILLFTFMMAGKPFAQFRYGVQGGGNLCNVNSTIELVYYNTNPLYSYNCGVFTEHPLSEKWFLHSGLFYTEKGFRGFVTPPNYTGTHLNYIAVPLLLGIKSTDIASFMIGPDLNYLVNAKYINKKNGYHQDITGNFTKFDLGLDLAVKINLSHRWGMEFLYCYGLTKIEKTSVYVNGQYIGSNIIGKNRVFQFDVCYNLGK